MATMTEGEPPSNAVTQLEAELQALLRKRSQYRVALETASDSRIIARMVADLKRLDDEITGFEEALSAVPRPSPAAPPLMALRPMGPASKASSLTFQTAMPDWDDEPATTLYDGASRVSLLPSAPPGSPSKGAAFASSGSVPPGERSQADRPRISAIEHSPWGRSSLPEPVPEAAALASVDSASSAAVGSGVMPRGGASPAPGGELSGSASSAMAESGVMPRGGASPAPGGELPGSVPPHGSASPTSAELQVNVLPASAEPSGSVSPASLAESDSTSPGGSSALPSEVQQVPSGPVSIHELEALEAQTQWNSELSPASFRLSEDEGWEPTLRTPAVPRLWLAVGGATVLVVLVLVWALV